MRKIQLIEFEQWVIITAAAVKYLNCYGKTVSAEGTLYAINKLS